MDDSVGRWIFNMYRHQEIVSEITVPLLSDGVWFVPKSPCAPSMMETGSDVVGILYFTFFA